MSYNVLVEAAAKADLIAAFEWYENQATGLGYEFLLSAEAAFAKLERNPFAYQRIHNDVRRVPVSRFPFGLFYIIDRRRRYPRLGRLSLPPKPGRMTKAL